MHGTVAIGEVNVRNASGQFADFFRGILCHRQLRDGHIRLDLRLRHRSQEAVHFVDGVNDG